MDDLTGWSSSVANEWRRLARSNPQALQAGDPIRFFHGEMILALAVTKRVARQANHLLATSLPRDRWADLVIDDLRSQDPGVERRSDYRRKAAGLARHRYGHLKLTGPELADAIQRA